MPTGRVGKGAWHNGNNEAEAYRAVPTIGRGGHGAIGIPLTAWPCNAPLPTLQT
jgi:hypothetical protein